MDHNATTHLAEGVADAVCHALIQTGNPSSVHAEGRAISAILEAARRSVAKAIVAQPLDIIFTSGGTEADHLGLIGLARAARHREEVRRCILLPQTVHPALWAAGEQLVSEGFTLESLPVDPSGRVRQESLVATLQRQDAAVLGVSLANHELGTLEDLTQLSALCTEYGCLVLGDAVQALGRIPVDVAQMGVSGLALSSHKIGGPKGMGALWLQPGLDVHPLIGGGKQEQGRRPGTQAPALAAGFAAAIQQVSNTLAEVAHVLELRDALCAGLGELGAEIHGTREGTLCNTISARFPGIPGDLVVAGMDLAGVAISTGAACSSGSVLPSPVLLAIGLSKREALESVRISVGPQNCRKEVEQVLAKLAAIVQRA